MATAVMKCRVCGKEYEACRSAKRVDGVFRWKDVACSPECGATYLDLIRESRLKSRVADDAHSVDEAHVSLDTEHEEDPDEELFWDDFDDEDADI